MPDDDFDIDLPPEVPPPFDWSAVQSPQLDVVDLTPPPPPPHGTPGTGGAQSQGPPAPLVRDRIVVLGRRKAGKSVYLARLYERLWNSKGELHMAAVDGRTHTSLLLQIDAMMKKRWPAATEAITHFKVDITYRQDRYLMIAPDYPGEIFKRAFMDGTDEPLVKDLLETCDRAAAVIVLVDPEVNFTGDLMTHSEQDYGLVAAIKRIRESPGAEFVPVAITLTKCDVFRVEIEEAGGPAKFVKENYSNLCRVAFPAGRIGMVFACAAVHVKRDGLGKDIPDLSKPPKGLIEPIEFCLRAMRVNRKELQQRQAENAHRLSIEAARVAAKELERKDRFVSNAFLLGSIVVAIVVVGILVIMLKK